MGLKNDDVILECPLIGFGPEGMPGRMCVISWVILTSVLNGKSLILSEDDIYVRS